MIDSQRGAYNHLISNKREWHNCFIRSNQKILPDLSDFALQEQTEFFGHGVMADKPQIKYLELNYTTI